MCPSIYFESANALFDVIRRFSLILTSSADYSSLSGKEYKPKSKSLPGAKIKSLESLRPIFADRLRFDVDVHSTNDRQN
jgi:hypothetical protein